MRAAPRQGLGVMCGAASGLGVTCGRLLGRAPVADAGNPALRPGGQAKTLRRVTPSSFCRGSPVGMPHGSRPGTQQGRHRLVTALLFR